MIPPAGGALIPYYTGPSEDFSRPGRTWWPVDGRTRFPKWGEVSIAYHEGVPGHHLQVAGVRLLTDELSRFQRTLTFISGHGEGWALYAERLMGELGYFRSEDFSRPGRTWWPVDGRTRFPKWGEVSIAYHEGVPGHHLQVAGVRLLTDELSRFQRTLTFISGHGEGWALYAERLMGELGYFQNPDYYLGMLSAQALRCVRVIIDIGMHLELEIPPAESFHPGEKWTHDLMLEFAVQRTQRPREFLQSEILRYLGWPAQAIAYKVGERKWLEARESARRSAGASFSLKDFHSRALALGPMGLDMLEAELAAEQVARGT